MAVISRSALLAEGTRERTDAYPPTGASGEAESDHQASGDAAGHRGSWRHFVRHFAEMVIAMMIGMPVGVGIFSSIVGENYKASRHDYPTAALLVMAISMTIPMVAWMRFRRHNWRNSMEMGTAMMLPVVPFLAEVWHHAVRDAPTGPYMTVSTVAMLVLMLYRWDVYSVHPPRSRRRDVG